MPFHFPRLLFASFLGLAFLAPLVRAQQTEYAREFDHPAAAQTAAAIKTLSPASQAVIARLAKLGDERIGGWKYYFGHLSGGQRTALDDSAWGEIRPSARINRTGENWLRKWIDIPATVDGYDLKGCRVLVSLMVHAYPHSELATHTMR